MIVLIILYLVFSTSGIILVKVASSSNNFSFSNNIINVHVNIWTILGLLFYIFSFLLWMVVLQKNNISNIYPIVTGASYIMIIFSSLVILNEKIYINQWIGIFVILIGIILMNIKSFGN